MKLSYEDHDTTTVLRVSGELTADQVDALRRTCQERMTSGIRNVVLDMEHMTLIDSAGLEFLLWLGEEVADHAPTGSGGGGQLRLVNPDETVRKILHITRLERRFVIHDTIESAAKSLR